MFLLKQNFGHNRLERKIGEIKSKIDASLLTELT